MLLIPPLLEQPGFSLARVRSDAIRPLRAPWPYLPIIPRGMGISSSAVLAPLDLLSALFGV